MKQRDLSLDIIRILSCTLVVFMHSPLPSEHADGPFLAALSYFTAPCIGLFFMVSGALLLPVKTDYFTFLKKRMAKIVIPTLLWTAIYVALNVYSSSSEINIFRMIASIPFIPQGNGVLWFMYTLVGLYLLAPILSAWVKVATDKELGFVLLLWGISLCYPLLSFIVNVNTSSTGILYYFTGYAGYFLLGYALKHGRIRIPIVIPTAIAVAGVLTLLALKRYNIEYDFYSLFWYESIIIVALCVVYWELVGWLGKRDINANLTRIISLFSRASFGVYLIHIVIMRYWLWHTTMIQNIHNYILQTLIIAFLTLIISVVTTIAISKLPKGKYITGA